MIWKRECSDTLHASIHKNWGYIPLYGLYVRKCTIYCRWFNVKQTNAVPPTMMTVLGALALKRMDMKIITGMGNSYSDQVRYNQSKS